MFLLSHNVKTTKLVNKLKNKMLSFFKIKILVKLLYKLKLLIIIKMYKFSILVYFVRMLKTHC